MENVIVYLISTYAENWKFPEVMELYIFKVWYQSHWYSIQMKWIMWYYKTINNLVNWRNLLICFILFYIILYWKVWWLICTCAHIEIAMTCFPHILWKTLHKIKLQLKYRDFLLLLTRTMHRKPTCATSPHDICIVQVSNEGHYT
jgi:hypothetical protein